MERIRKVDRYKLRLWREKRWLTQQRLAKRAGLTKNTIFRIEKGLNKSPQVGTLQAIAGALEIPPEALLEDLPADAYTSNLEVRPLANSDENGGSLASDPRGGAWDFGRRVEVGIEAPTLLGR